MSEKYDNEIQTNTNKQEENIETNRQNIINKNNDNKKEQEKKEENNTNNNIDNNLNINNISDNFEKTYKKNDSKKEIILNKEEGQSFSFNKKSSGVSLHNENISKNSSKKKIDIRLDYDSFNNKINEYKERASIKKENEVTNTKKIENNYNIENKKFKKNNGKNNDLYNENVRKESKVQKSEKNHDEDEGISFNFLNKDNNDNNSFNQNNKDSNNTLGLPQYNNNVKKKEQIIGNKNNDKNKKFNNLDEDDNNYSNPVYINSVRVWNKNDFVDKSESYDEDEDMK